MTETSTTPTVALTPEEEQALVTLVLRGMARDEATEAEVALVAAGMASERGTIRMPTAAGAARAAELCRLEPGSEQEAAVRELFHTFLPVNRALREVCTDWQVRAGAANDHTDAAYDAEVRDRVDDIHTRIDRIVRRLATHVPSLEHYRADLAEALARFDDGDTSALTSPLTASYHTVWMWLHHELLLMLGVSRAEDEQLEERLVAEQRA